MRDNLNKDLEALQKKARVIEASVTTAERELEAFQVQQLFYPFHTLCLCVSTRFLFFFGGGGREDSK